MTEDEIAEVERRHDMKEFDDRLTRVEGEVSAMRKEFKDHHSREEGVLESCERALDSQSENYDKLHSRMTGIEKEMSKQKGFWAGALFAVTALGYVLKEWLSRLLSSGQ